MRTKFEKMLHEYTLAVNKHAAATKDERFFTARNVDNLYDELVEYVNKKGEQKKKRKQ